MICPGIRLLRLIVAVLLVTRGPLWSEDGRLRGWLHLNGYTHHFDAPDTNERLYGVGISWPRRDSDGLSAAWEADVFRDSGCRLSALVGHSWTYRQRQLQAGLTAALMYHRNFATQNRWRLLPVALPFVELPLRGGTLRAYYVPPIRNQCDQQVAVQLLVPLAW